MIYTEPQLSVLRHALQMLIELLKSPTSADRDADPNQADRDVGIATQILANLEADQAALQKAQESLVAIRRYDDVIDDIANGSMNARAPDGDDYNEIFGFAMTALGYLGNTVSDATQQTPEAVPSFMLKPITTPAEADAFTRELVTAGKDYHYDDAPESIVNIGTGARTFTDAECVALKARMSELFAFPGYDPFGLLVFLTNSSPERLALDEEMFRLTGEGLNSAQRDCLGDEERRTEAIEMLEDLRARIGISADVIAMIGAEWGKGTPGPAGQEVQPPQTLNFKVMLTLRTSCGCVGQGVLGTGKALTWDADSVGETMQAILGRIDAETLEIVEVVEMDGDDWREFEEVHAEASLVAYVANGYSLEEALQEMQASQAQSTGGRQTMPADSAPQEQGLTSGHAPEAPPGGYFVMYGYEKSADHCATLSEARASGQKLCDEDPLPGPWSIHDADGDFVEDIERTDGRSMSDQVRDFNAPA